MLVFDRVVPGRTIRCIYNMTPNEHPAADHPAGHLLLAVNGVEAVQLPGYSAR